MSNIDSLVLKRANKEDITKEVEFIRQVPYLENGFANFFYNVLQKSDEEIFNYVMSLSYSFDKIPIITYFLWQDNTIVGMFHLLAKLTEDQKNKDGHISYTVLKEYRGKGYASKGLELLIEEAKTIVPEDELYMHTTINNPSSLKVMLNNNAYVTRNDEFGIFTRIKIK
jgi:predicted acetyltransferase